MPLTDCRGRHREAVGQGDAGASGLEQIEEFSLLAVIRTGGVAEGGPDSTIALGDKVLVRQVFVASVAPIASRAGMKILRERFSEPIGERLDHDGVIVVMVAFERRCELGCPVTGRDRESADEVDDAAAPRGDEIGKGQIQACRSASAPAVAAC